MYFANMIGKAFQGRRFRLGASLTPPGSPNEPLSPIFLNDTFSGPDTLLTVHTPEVGGSWRMETTGAFRTGEGYVYSPVAGTDIAINNAVPPSADYYVESVIDYLSNNSNQFPAIVGRYQPNGEFYMFRYNAGTSNRWELFKFAGNTFTSLATYSESFSSGSRTMRLALRGNSIKGLVNGVERCSVTDSSITGAGMVGIRENTQTSPTSGRLLTNITAGLLT